MLAAWAQYWSAMGVEIVCRNTGATGVAYAQRLGLFKFLEHEPPTSVEEHEEAGRFVEIQHIHRQPDLSKLVGDLGALLKLPELIEVVQYVVSEMTRNVIEHAGADAFVCVQHYKAAGRVSIGIADAGKGVLSTLRRYHNFQTNAEAVVGALRPGVTGTTPAPYGSFDNAGLGLFYARGLAKLTNQYFLLVSGDAAYRLKHKQKTRTPSRDPRADGHDLFEGLKPWEGTAVAIDIAATNTSLSTMFKAISSAAGPDDGLRDIKTKIIFT